MVSSPANPEANIQRHIEWIEKISRYNVDWCLFPKMSITGFCFDRRFFEVSEPFGGKSIQKMVEVAKQFNLIVGFKR